MVESEMQVKEPGKAVKALMDARGWSQTDLAYVLGVTAATINQVIKSKRPITAEMARLMAVAFDIPDSELAELQARWNVKNAPEPDAAVRARAKVQSNYPLRAMIKRGWIGDPNEGADLDNELCRFFQVNSLEQAPHLEHSAKKTSYDEAPGAQLAWLFRVRQIAKEMPTPPFSKDKLAAAVEEFKKYRESPEEIRHIPRLLHEAGVRFVIVEGLPGGRIDGVCFWLDDAAPVIGLSLRYDRIDNFWFVLIHECSHVMHGHGRSKPIIDVDLDGDQANVSDEERLVNAEAQEFCIPKMKIQSFYLRKKPFFSDRDVAAFAKINGVHPGLVVGQLHHLSGQYKILRQHLIKIWQYVTSSALVDGWGDIIPVD